MLAFVCVLTALDTSGEASLDKQKVRGSEEWTRATHLLLRSHGSIAQMKMRLGSLFLFRTDQFDEKHKAAQESQ